MVPFAARLIFSFGFAAFLGLFALWFRQPAERRAHSPYGLPFLYSSAWFAVNLLTADFALLLAAACGFPAILLHLFRLRHVVVIALAGAATAALALSSRGGFIPVEFAAAVFSCLLAYACIQAARLQAASRTSGWFLVACVLLVPVALYAGAPWFRLFVRSLPLSLLLFDSYTRRRFLFFDLFVKWGLYFLLALSVLSLWFAFIPSNLDPLTLALLMVPVLWAVPRLCRLLGQRIDSRFLHRPYSPAEAEHRLAEALRSAPDEEAACRVAERELGHIFGGEVMVAPAGAEHSGAEREAEAEFALPLESEPGYVVQVRRSPQARPFFSQDFELLHTLGRTLAFVLDNRRLEARKRDLVNEASRAELKALRAQVNPHFLFNALNTVAGLIPRFPQQAETVVEKLAEVFRYTLRRSESEWATLGEELETTRAYLDVEQARYGARLEVSIEAGPELLGWKVPSMTLLTLVENAVKHGVARTTEQCPLMVRASLESGKLVVEVRDGGPGPLQPSLDGFGLQNVETRLERYYGGRASLRLERDDRAGETVARLEVPAC